MKTIGIAGGTGFVGRYITRELEQKGHNVIILTRDAARYKGTDRVTYATLDAKTRKVDEQALSRLDAVINLSGAGVADARWTAARKKEILDSRVDTTLFLIEQLKLHAANCQAYVAASAIGFYGPDQPGQGAFTEDAPPYTDFLGDTCQKWENASRTAEDRYRTVLIRIGIVLGKESGALKEFLKPMTMGVMPYLGGGQQVMSWIAVEDLARLFVYAAENNHMEGTYNGVAPDHCTQRHLMQTIKHVKGGLAIPVTVPSFILKAMLGEMSIEVLKSCTVSANKTLASGFSYKYTGIESALKAILTEN